MLSKAIHQGWAPSLDLDNDFEFTEHADLVEDFRSPTSGSGAVDPHSDRLARNAPAGCGPDAFCRSLDYRLA